MPKVSVLLPVYNGEKYLEKSLISVLNQTYNDLEVLVLNDGSTDQSLQIINKYAKADSRIRIINFEKNVGLIAVLNEGIDKSAGEYLARIDSDDEWNDASKINKQVEFLDTNIDFGLVGTLAIKINEAGESIGRMDVAESDVVIRNKILIKNQFIHSSVMFRKDLAKLSGLYKNDEKYVEDYGLWLRLGQNGKFANLNFYGLKYRVNSGGETATKNRQQVINSFKLVNRYKSKYPNYFLACFKWFFRYLKTFIKL